MWAARHLSERQQRKFVGAGGTSRPRPSRTEAVRARNVERSKELRGGARDYVQDIPVRVGVDEAGNPSSAKGKPEDFSMWDWAKRQTCQSCARKPTVRVCQVQQAPVWELHDKRAREKALGLPRLCGSLGRVRRAGESSGVNAQ